MGSSARSDVRQRRLAVGGGAAATLSTLLAVAFTPVATAAPGVGTAVAPDPPDGWTTVWEDDFTGAAGSLPSAENWIFDIGHNYPGGAPNWGTGEIAAHTDDPSNVSLDGSGNLRITPRRDEAGNWTSARIETKRTDFEPPTGGVLRIEGRLRLPDVSGAEAQGIWPAFWALGAPFRGVHTNWPDVGEIDIMENVNGQNTIVGTMHCGVAPGGPCNEFTGLGSSRSDLSPSPQAAFHTYAIEWDRSTSREEIRWFIDGEKYHTVTEDQVDAATWTKATNHGYFVILNVAVGGNWPGLPTAATAPGRPMLVDYVAVYSRGGSSPPTGNPPTSNPPTGTTPTSTPPTSGPPTSNPPTGNPPTSNPPTSNPPTSNPPTSNPPTSNPPGGGGRDAYARIEAAHFDAQTGVTVLPTGELGELGNGDGALYRGVRFGSTPARQFTARVASGAGPGISGLVEVRLDSATSPPVGTFSVANTGGWTSYREIPGNVADVTGTHDVHLTFTSGQKADYVQVDWFTFAH